MNKLIALVLIASFVASSNYGYNGSTTAAVALVGGIIKAKHIDKEKKYPRKKCPVCKGTGKYLSGDSIEMVDCGYCEPENIPGASSTDQASKSPFCKCEHCKCENCNCKPKSVIIVK